MTPPVAESSYDDAQLDPRPTKRARKSSTKSRDSNDNHNHNTFTPPAPVDHIFITDGIITKKPGGKKVNFTLFPLISTAERAIPGSIVLLRMQKVCPFPECPSLRN